MNKIRYSKQAVLATYGNGETAEEYDRKHRRVPVEKYSRSSAPRESYQQKRDRLFLKPGSLTLMERESLDEAADIEREQYSRKQAAIQDDSARAVELASRLGISFEAALFQLSHRLPGE